jgi:Protein of unknown function (DUF3306)
LSDTESFLARWARLKREANAAAASAKSAEPSEAVESAKAAECADAAERAEAAKPAKAAERADGAECAEAAAEPAEAAVAQNSCLPSIESITRRSDIRPFLQAGVPVELTRAALRAAWVADPSIRDFIGIADSQWDFNDPTAMPGFGPLEATDSARSFAERAVARIGRAPEALVRTSGVAAVPVTETTNLPREGQVDSVWISPESRKSVSNTGIAPAFVQESSLMKEPALVKESALLQESALANEPVLLQEPALANEPDAVVERRPGARVHGSALPKLAR